MMTQTTHHPDQLKALDAALNSLHKQYGPGAVMRLDGSIAEQVGVPISTGSLSLAIALGIGGLPRGRMVEIYGPEASGKTTLALHAIASVQAQGGIAAIIDAEHALDPKYAAHLGVRLDQLLVSQPDSGEQGLEIAEQMCRSGAVDLIVIDSVAALVPEVELEGQMGDQQVGLQARMMSKALRKLTGVVSRTRCTVIFINQLRQKIGVVFGPSEVTTGGNALKYYASVRIEVRRGASIKVGDKVMGAKTNAKVVKNKLAAPFRNGEFDLLYGEGVDRLGELVDLGESHGVVQRAGAWYAFGDERLGQGRDKARATLAENDVLRDRIEQLVKSASGVPSLCDEVS
ncbi:MAG: hypothetical protein RIT28_4473 [Pseudomonadota bacterium]